MKPKLNLTARNPPVGKTPGITIFIPMRVVPTIIKPLMGLLNALKVKK